MATEAIRQTIDWGDEQMTYAILTVAIRERRLVQATYDGFGRVLQPHLVGYSDGTPMLHAYQVGGESHEPLEEPGSPKNWRCFRIALLTDVQLVDGSWIAFPEGHGGHQHCIGQIDWPASHGWMDDSTHDDENSEGGDWDAGDWIDDNGS